MVEIKNTVPEMKNSFDGLISRVDMTEGKKKISDLENMITEISKTEKLSKKKKFKKRTRTEQNIQEL